MRYVAAYMLSSLSGKEPSAADIEKILSSVGIETDSSKLEKVISQLKGKSIDELVASGKKYYRKFRGLTRYKCEFMMKPLV